VKRGALPRVPASASWLHAPALLLRSARRRPLVVSFPKSGRTWLRVMLDALAVDAEYTHFGAGVNLGLPAAQLAPEAWWCARRPTLLLVREPRDTLVSSYHQATRRRRCYAGTLPSFVRDPRYGIEKVVRWNLAWARFALGSDTLALVSYEALREGGPALLGAVARHLGAPRSEEALRAAFAAASFDAMRAREAAGAGSARYGKALTPRDAADPDSFKVRKGVVGGWRDELDAADAEYCAEVLARFDYEAELAAALARRGLRAPV
jgi:hypothetical protein